jgi:hypothetical protein
LIALPIAGSTGTANPIYNLPLCHAATWFAAILILLEYLTLDDSKSVWLRIICMISVGSFTTSQIIQGYIFNPQTNGRNLHYQVNPTNIGYPSTVLKLDIGESNLIAELSLAAKSNGFKMGDDIIAFNFIPGVVYAMGGRSPGHPTFIVGSEEREAYSRLALNFSNIDRLKKSFVLLDVDANIAGKVLATKGIDFPENYELIASVNNPNKIYTLWKPLF